MIDIHLHCVYFKYEDTHDIKGVCLLKNKLIKTGFGNCCNDIVLKPYYILSYFLKDEHYCESGSCVDKKVFENIERMGYNSYPKNNIQ